MNNEEINKQIASLEEEVSKLKAIVNKNCKPEKFEFKYEYWKCHSIYSYRTYNDSPGSDKDFLANFRYRQTEANAKADFQLQKELMCIGAIAEQLDPNYKSKIDWDSKDYKYFIDIDKKTNKYTPSSCVTIIPAGAVLMQYDLAVQVCKILNEKQVEL